MVGRCKKVERRGLEPSALPLPKKNCPIYTMGVTTRSLTCAICVASQALVEIYRKGKPVHRAWTLRDADASVLSA